MPLPSETTGRELDSSVPAAAGQSLLSFCNSLFWKLTAAYLILLGVTAFLARWTPEYLHGRDLWHFTLSRMVVPMLMFAAVAAFVRLIPAALALATALLFVGTISAIKREATGEPLQVSDFFLAGQSADLTGYVDASRWLVLAALVAALIYAVTSFRFRRWSLPLFAVAAALLSSYRFESVVNYIHDHGPRIGIENLTFSQAESERMNGIATHLYFSTAGLRLKTFPASEVKAALANLDVDPLPAPAAGAVKPDIYIVLGEAWWRDPRDTASPIDKLVTAGFAEGKAVSPVYGGTTPNAEFEVLTAVPVKSFQAGIIPYQHYLHYLTDAALSLPRLLENIGYESRAFHDFTSRFWLRDQVYPRLGFESFEAMDHMQLTMQPNGWPRDAGLYDHVLAQEADADPQFRFLVTVETHGPYAEDKTRDVIDGVFHPGISDYHDRLGSAVDALVGFNTELKKRGRPYVLLVFGDHLPGLRLHQWKSGMKSETDPRLHQSTFLVASNTADATAMRDRFDGRPFTCLSPTLVDWLGLGIGDRYFRHVAKRCKTLGPQPEIPSEAVIQNQLFSKQPEL